MVDENELKLNNWLKRKCQLSTVNCRLLLSTVDCRLRSALLTVNYRLLLTIVLLMVGLGFVSSDLSARTKGKVMVARKTSLQGSSTLKYRAGRKPLVNSAGVKHRPISKSGPRSKTLKARSLRARNKARWAAPRPQPQRIIEIQQALINAAELHQEPTGTWDEQTREAMRRYQKSNGVPATGLPDAKSLMKLGLGPHPLPLEVDSSAAARAGIDPSKSRSQ